MLRVNVDMPDPPFIRSDCNQDQAINIGDPIFLLGVLFSMRRPSSCEDACDPNDDGSMDIGDAVYQLTTLFQSGPPPGPPFPGCGSDPTPDDLGCLSYPCP